MLSNGGKTLAWSVSRKSAYRFSGSETRQNKNPLYRLIAAASWLNDAFGVRFWVS